MRTLILAALALTAGCSSAPGTPETAMASPTAAATPESAAPQSATSDEQRQVFKPPAGYRTKINGWDIVYCTKISVLGSRFPKELCMTEAQLKERLAMDDEMRRDKDQVSRVCSQAAGCANP